MQKCKIAFPSLHHYRKDAFPVRQKLLAAVNNKLLDVFFFLKIALRKYKLKELSNIFLCIRWQKSLGRDCKNNLRKPPHRVKLYWGRDLESASRTPVALTSHLQVLHHHESTRTTASTDDDLFFLEYYTLTHLRANSFTSGLHPHPCAKCVFFRLMTRFKHQLNCIFSDQFTHRYFSFLILAVFPCQEQIATM